jgi:cytochrome c peroxidase
VPVRRLSSRPHFAKIALGFSIRRVALSAPFLRQCQSIGGKQMNERTKNLLRIAAALAIVALITPRSQAAASDAAQLRTQAQETLGVLPPKMPGAEKDTPAMIELGRKLYFEKQLSRNNSQSCNSCHQLEPGKGGADADPTSLGAFGKRGGRNSPTVLNAGFQLAQFWDGRAENLEAQAKGPVLNPVEMAMPDEKEVLKRLSADKQYPSQFSKAFPGAQPAITYDNVARAIAAFERTLRTNDRFDDFLKGSDKALTSTELRGLKTFMEIGCAACHNGPLLGGNAYHKVGLVHEYPTSDAGRFDVTKDDGDKQKFKVPMLRNIALTAPYFHDGKFSTLEDTVQTMARIQLDKTLTPEEKQDIVAFLRSLTDKERDAMKLK